MSEFSEAFKARVGAELSVELRATKGSSPDRLNPEEIAILMGARGDNGFIDNQVWRELIAACSRKALKADATTIGTYGEVLAKHVQFIIHRDDARRYFKDLGLEPLEGSPLWCWLRAKRAEDAGKPSFAQQDKADFQQKCKECWDLNPTTTIRGKAGVVANVGVGYLRSYKVATLCKWASEVAPDSVKKAGRPQKTIKLKP